MEFRVIRQKALVDASPDEVFDAYVDPRAQTEFTGSKAAGATKVGGKFTAWDGYIKGKHVRLDRGKKIVQEWTTTEWPKGYPPSMLEITLSPKGKKTELVMIHSKVPADQADEYAQGWTDYYWEPLKEHFKKKQ